MFHIAHIGQQTPLQRSPLLASTLAHVIAAILIFSVAAPRTVRQASHVFMPLFAPEPKRVISETRRPTLPVMASAPRPLALPARIATPVSTPQPLPERKLHGVPNLNAPPPT